MKAQQMMIIPFGISHHSVLYACHMNTYTLNMFRNIYPYIDNIYRFWFKMTGLFMINILLLILVKSMIKIYHHIDIKEFHNINTNDNYTIQY